jgi:hypothetical protein
MTTTPKYQTRVDVECTDAGTSCSAAMSLQPATSTKVLNLRARSEQGHLSNEDL